MNGAGPQRQLEEILIRALDTPPEQREEYLRQACDDDAALIDRIRNMVRGQHEDPDATESISAGTGSRGTREGRRIGPYTLHAAIGSGTFGVVYLATRDDELKRRVAIKVLKPSMDPARFRAETQYLALLNHPHIVKVFDFGQTDRGELYFVMEYVDGQDLTAYCRARRVTLAGRLELFYAICQAVSAAHRVPLVHRDLKPDNIRVTVDGEPKLLDFGLARLLHQDLALHIKAPTMPGTMAGTWVYASPEQLRGEPVTTATDIYSLGVILYELLSGKVVFAREDITLAEFSRSALEQDPPGPSKCVLSSEDGHNVAAEMQLAGAHGLASRLSGELDAIALMTLRKEPDRRYPSAEALAADIRAYLDGYPVRARPDSFGYRARKLVRRHRALTAVSCLAVASITGGLMATTYLMRQAEQARRFAEQSLHRMQIESGVVQAALDNMTLKDVPNLAGLSRVEDAREQAQRNPTNGAARSRLVAELRQLYEADEQAGDFRAAVTHCRQAEQVQPGDEVSARCLYLEGRARSAEATGHGAFGQTADAVGNFDALRAAQNYLALGKLRAAGRDTAAAREAFNRAIVLFEMAASKTPQAQHGLSEARAERQKVAPQP